MNKRYDELATHLVHDGKDDWEVIRSKVSGAYSVSLFTEFSEEDIEELLASMKKDTDPAWLSLGLNRSQGLNLPLMHLTYDYIV